MPEHRGAGIALQIRRALDAQRMHGEGVGPQPGDSVQRLRKILRRLSGKSRDDIHIDIAEACRSCKEKSPLRFLRRMASADEL